MVNFIDIYHKTCREKGWSVDQDQLHTLHVLQDMMQAIEAEKKEPFIKRILPFKKDTLPRKQGLYLYGDVGRGKSFVMDLFFENAPIKQKSRQHFYQFMLNVHDHMHEQRKSGAKDRIDMDLMRVAQDIAKDTRLLCFDEMFVEDVADAMLLGRLFTALFDAGVYIVMTSNIKPDDLYKNGLQRDRFVPFIELLKEKTEVVAFDGDKDYRSENIRDYHRFLYPDDDNARTQMQNVFETLTDGEKGAEYQLEVKKRIINLPCAAKGTVMVPFELLCSDALGPGDYLALSERFKAVILTGIPKLDDKQRNEVRRFMTLIDTLYERGVTLFATADAPFSEIYAGETYEKPFARTLSRLTEMQSPDYPEN